MKIPKILRPMDCLGVEFQGESGEELYGSCIFCGDARHFYANSETGQFSCKKCNVYGNVPSFLTKYAKQVQTDVKYKQLAKARSLPAAAFRKWRIGHDGEQWLLPCYNPAGVVHDIRRWSKGKNILSTAGCKSQLFGLHFWSHNSLNDIWLCEGEWDGIALKHALMQAGREEDVVLAVPGADTFKKDWVEYFARRRVRLMYDNDEAGDRGSKKAGGMLGGVAVSVQYIHWPDSRPTGFDLRDYLTSAWKEKVRPKRILSRLQKLIHTEHRRADSQEGEAVELGKKSEMPPLPDIGIVAKRDRPTFSQVVERFSNYLEMDDEMVGCLRMVLAVIVSNQLAGPPLWAYLQGPPASGKTEMIQAAQTSDQVIYRSSVGPHSLVSGFQGATDPSLLAIVHGKTLLFKDGTEIFTLPAYAREEVMGVFRGAYDGHVVRSYGNSVMREYRMHFSMIIGVTGVVNSYRSASLGERFLKYVLRRASIAQEARRIRSAIFATAKEDEMERVLREAVRKFLAFKVKDLPEVPAWYVNRIIPLCQLIATLRASVDRNDYHDELSYRPEPEYGTRLAKQLTKLAMSVAIVNGTEIDEEVYAFVMRIAGDTCNAYHLDIVQTMAAATHPLTYSELSDLAQIPSSTMKRRMDDLIDLKAVVKRMLTEKDKARFARETQDGRLGRKPVFGFVLANRMRKFLANAGFGNPKNRKR